MKSSLYLIGIATVLAGTSWEARGESVARLWNEENLAAIRIDFPNPPLHARNLFHTSLAMWDAWAVYEPSALGCVAFDKVSAEDVDAARAEAVSYAAYRVLTARYAHSRAADVTLPALTARLVSLGYDPNVTTTEGDSPAAVGNRVAETVLGFCLHDGAREATGYGDASYAAVNEPLILQFDGTTMLDPNRWQPLAFDVAFTQNGLEASQIQTFVAPHWGDTRPFALRLQSDETIYHDPGMPPQLGDSATDAAFKAGNVEVIRRSSQLDPSNGDLIDISPSAYGNHSLGANDGTGRELNPFTGEPYASNVVPHGDFGRVLAEFWADGPDSETPPGHWNVLANEVTDAPGFVRQIEGVGPEVDPLEWDVKLYFALNAATHDAAVASWWCKRTYDYVRPISSIRYMGSKGQSSDPGGLSYDPEGLPLVEGLIEVVTESSSAPGGRHEHLSGHVGEIAILAWGGEPADPETSYTGAEWILAVAWLPYQRSTFVTPAFAGYVSGHSTFSRAAAEVLTRMTGSPFFPGGLGRFRAEKDAFLKFEQGPSMAIELQWATYYDAADQAGISRLYGGIHVPADDGPGRVIGSACGEDAWNLAKKYYSRSIEAEPIAYTFALDTNGDLELEWDAFPGFYYWVETSADLANFVRYSEPERAESVNGAISIPGFVDGGPRFVRVLRSIEGE